MSFAREKTPAGRPAPLMIYKACAELGVWPLSRVVKVDDAEAGVAEGKAAGAFTVGVAASGNAVGLSLRRLARVDGIRARSPTRRRAKVAVERGREHGDRFGSRPGAGTRARGRRLTGAPDLLGRQILFKFPESVFSA